MNIFDMIKGRTVIASNAVLDTNTAPSETNAPQGHSVATKGISCALVIDSCDELDCHELFANDCDFLVDLL